jgi:ABC-type antimicrobial peptide transport system permease subunit
MDIRNRSTRRKLSSVPLCPPQIPHDLRTNPGSRVLTVWAMARPVAYVYQSFYYSVQFFIIYVPSQQLQGQLQTQHSVDTSNYIMVKQNIKSKTNYRQALKEKHIMQKSEQTNKQRNNNNFINTNRSYYWGLRNVKYKYLEKIIIKIQYNSCLYTCKLNTSEANYKVNTST